ncbi:ABC transporter permease [Sungkyunkwania multivorans]|uniref:ABC transporter permease n=1 Tax=Sungkyunkwania multivorans TaxID=1173618 RepID=A0ABW3D258_9FLAO
MNHLPIIIKREYLNKVRNRSFIIMTFLSPIIMIALVAVVAYLSQLNNDKVREIAVLDESRMFTEVLKDTDKTKFKFFENTSLNAAREEVKEKELYGLLHIPKESDHQQLAESITFYSQDSPSLLVMDSLNDLISNKLTDINMKENEVNIEMIKALEARVNIRLENFSGEETSELGSFMKLGFGGLAGYLLFMFIIIYGNMIMRSVIEEKTSRIIEVIISSVKPVQLMLGKIIGTSLAGITQFLIWVVLGGVMLFVVSAIIGINISELQSPQQELLMDQAQNPVLQEKIGIALMEFVNLPWLNLITAFLFFFVGGYLLYSSLYAAIGAAVDNETDTQQFMMPILMPLILAVYVGVFTVIENPHGTVSTVFSMIPLTSPVVMLMRIPFGVPLWQQILSLVLLFATFALVVWLAAKIYRVGILMYGKKASYKELYKWLKY